VTGTDESSLRLPSVLCSLALLVVVFLMGRSLAGPAAGLLAALTLAFSGWDVHGARMARMYPLLLLLFTLGVYLILLGLGRGRGARRARWWALPCTVLAVFTHQLGVALGLVFLVPLLLPRKDRPPMPWLFAGVLAAGAPLAVMRFVSRIANRGEAIPVNLVEERSSVNLPLLGPLELKGARLLLLEIWRESPVLGGLGLLLFLLLGAWLLRWLLRSGAGPWALLAAVAFLLAVATNSLVLAALLAALLVKLYAASVPEALRLLSRLGMVFGAGVLLLLLLLGPTVGWGGLVERSLLRSFLTIPQPWWKLLLLHYPVTSFVVLAGLAFGLLASLRPGADQRLFVLGGAFLAPLLLMGLRPSPYFLVRYTVYLHPFLALLFALTVLWAARALATTLTGRGDPEAMGRGWRTPPGRELEPPPSRAARGLTALLVAGCVLLPGNLMSLRDAWGVSRRDYGWNRDRIGDPSLVSHFYYDAKTTALYVRERRSPGDIVIARDPVNLFPYLGQSDYLLRGRGYAGMARSSEGLLVDKTLGIPVLSSRSALETVLREHADRRIWIVSSEKTPGGPDLNLPDDLIALLVGLDSHRVYTARDGISFVLEIAPGIATGE
jgi:hypothetical protein